MANAPAQKNPQHQPQPNLEKSTLPPSEQPALVVEVVVLIESGLHARPAAAICKIAKSFANSSIKLTCGGRCAPANSIWNVMLLEASSGSTITIAAQGTDAAQAVAAISAILSNPNG